MIRRDCNEFEHAVAVALHAAAMACNVETQAPLFEHCSTRVRSFYVGEAKAAIARVMRGRYLATVPAFRSGAAVPNAILNSITARTGQKAKQP